MFTLLAKTKKFNFHLHLFPRDTSSDRFWPIADIGMLQRKSYVT